MLLSNRPEPAAVENTTAASGGEREYSIGAAIQSNLSKCEKCDNIARGERPIDFNKLWLWIRVSEPESERDKSGISCE